VILFGSERPGKWSFGNEARCSDPVQITHLEGWNGCAFISATIKPSSFEPGALPMPSPKTPPAMTLFTIQEDGTRLTPLTHDEANCLRSSPDGHHYVFVKVFPEQLRDLLGDLTAISRCGSLTTTPRRYPRSRRWPWLVFTSTATPLRAHNGVYLQDISSLHIGP